MLDKGHIQPDLSIAATAQHYDLTTVSRDTSDFEKACITVFNPWIEAAPPETEQPDVAMRVSPPLKGEFVRIAVFAVPTFVPGQAVFPWVLPTKIALGVHKMLIDRHRQKDLRIRNAWVRFWCVERKAYYSALFEYAP
jgi:hypothetical protein